MKDKYFENIDAILFDLDGVLLNTEDAYTCATRAVLGGRADEFTWELKSRLMGLAPMNAAKYLIDVLGLQIKPDEFLQQLKQELRPLFSQIQATPGAEAMVSRGLKMPKSCAIATSSTRALFLEKTKSSSFISTIPVVICADDSQITQAKPQPDIFLQAAKALNVAPHRCLVFEDSPAGVLAARRAGAGRIIGLCHPQMKPKRLAGCDHIIESFVELL